ncbi:MAG: phage tail tube protein [Candidatus Methanoperedens sp.]
MTNAIKGVDLLIKVEISGSYTSVAEQTNATLKLSKKLVTATSKDSYEWEENLQSTKNWQMDCDALLVEGDTARAYLENAYLNDLNISVTMKTPATTTGYYGDAVMSDLTYAGGTEDIATFKATLKGTGALARA